MFIVQSLIHFHSSFRSETENIPLLRSFEFYRGPYAINIRLLRSFLFDGTWPPLLADIIKLIKALLITYGN